LAQIQRSRLLIADAYLQQIIGPASYHTQAKSGKYQHNQQQDTDYGEHPPSLRANMLRAKFPPAGRRSCGKLYLCDGAVAVCTVIECHAIFL
jgi:hypothetical protein